jgi:16S rRNA (cytosine967-C5)-methyltransferase
MRPTDLIEHATDLMHSVMRFEHPADRVVSDFFRKQRHLGSKERHMLAETIYAVLRRRVLFEQLAKLGKGEPARRLVLLGWCGNDAYLRAAISPAEEEWLQAAHSTDKRTLPESTQHNLPDWLAQTLRVSMGEDFWPFAQSSLESAPLDLRVNAFKAKREDVQAALLKTNIQAEFTPYSPLGLRLLAKTAVNKSDVFVRGEIEVQDEGSQLLALITGAKRGEMVVDFCAGAGGKTLALGAAMRNTGRLYAFDISGHRLAELKPRLARSGLSNVYPIQVAHERDERIKRLYGKVDRVLVDAPCSGLGTLRRNPDLKWRQTPQSVDELCTKQMAILSSAARLLKPGGFLVYATCSPLEAENEHIAQAFNAAQTADPNGFEAVPVLELLQQAHVANADALIRGPYLRLWPHLQHTDGFFAAAWRKSS